MSTSKLQINLTNFAHNINQIKSKINKNTKIIAVVKADAYGNGVCKLIDTLLKNNIEYVAVANAIEGSNIRSLNNDLNILILNQPPKEDIETIVSNNLICGACDKEFLMKLNEVASKKNVTIKIHLEVDTGAGRNGVLLNNVKDIVKYILTLKNIELDGIYTHFTCSDCDDEYTLNQIEKFDKAIEIVKSYGLNVKAHASNSAAIINYPEANYDLVRPGLILYGYYPDESIKGRIDIKPVEKWVSEVTYIKEVPKGSAISYNKTFVTNKKSKIAVVPVGYADGYRRSFSNKAEVVINGQKVKVVGTVCMDMIMVDVTNIDVKVGDKVYLFDNELVTVEDLAALAGTINYEIIAGIGKRVERECEN
ncbi:MAG: alanine racemase [Clostridia bacterium]|nr:alanine racemase [Clostridia bacterium]